MRPGFLTRLFRRSPAPLGARGERTAAKWLRKNGFRVLARNVRLPMGEIDLLVETRDRVTVVVVEVKSRALRPGDPERMPERQITGAKARKLVTLAKSLSRRRGLAGRPLRIDVIAVDFDEAGERVAAIRHYPDAVR
jgi:putative endonuclease